MTYSVLYDVQKAEVSQSFISKLHFSISNGLPHAEPISVFRTNEKELVQGVLEMLLGFSSSIFYWDDDRQEFCFKDGIYLSHLSQASLSAILNQFAFGGTCLKKVEFFVKKVEASHQRAPTLKGFANSVKSWLKRLRDIALKEEVKLAVSESGKSVTLLGLTDSTSSLCSGAEYLVQVVYEAIPSTYFDPATSLQAGEMSVHILDHLFKKLNEVCLVQGGEEEAYHMLLVIFMESLLPYLEGLDSWLYEGTLDDPYEEMFFYSNGAVTIDQPAFWELSYLLRPASWKKSRSGEHLIPCITEATMQVKKEASDLDSVLTSTNVRGRDQNDLDGVLCPVFLKNMGRAIISAGKSLQLVRHVRDDYVALVDRVGSNEFRDSVNHRHKVEFGTDSLTQEFEDVTVRYESSHVEPILHSYQTNYTRETRDLTLSEGFLISLAGLIGDGDHIYEFFRMSFPEIAQISKTCMSKQKLVDDTGESLHTSVWYKKNWFKFFTAAVSERSHIDTGREAFSQFRPRGQDCSYDTEEVEAAAATDNLKLEDDNIAKLPVSNLIHSFCPRNPVVTVCTEFLQRNMANWNELNISKNFHLPPLNDESLRETIFGEKYTEETISGDLSNRALLPRFNGTDYTLGFQFDRLSRLRLEHDTKTLETLFPFPTLLPCFQEDLSMSDLLPFQKNSTLASKVLNWTESIKLKDTPQPAVIIKECLAVYVKRQVDHIGKHILLKLMTDWKLMDELSVLRAIYLLGSGDLLKEFLLVIYDKMDRGDSWGDDFELNTVLQESIRNSADGTLLSAPDSLVVSIMKNNASDDEESSINSVTTPRKLRNQSFGIDAFDILNFTYKVSWPLDLIANAEALKKYNQVMSFLLKVKRAKFVLDKARRWMWKKGGRSTTHNYKRHLLVEQKLLHFVDAFHQYVMDRVFHSAWIELCTGMASAGSLDEVIEVHEAYLLSIQRQCFVAPDKLWALIASRIKNILGLALDFYSIQQTLNSGGTAPAVKARCEVEVDRIEKQFDDCIAFLLRILSFKLNVGHFPHLADLVTRINYNYFYMSDSGNLLTVPKFEAPSSRLAKSAAFKAE